MRFNVVCGATMAAIAGCLTASAAGGGVGGFYDVTTVFVGEENYGGGGSDIEYYGSSSGVTGWAAGTTACNLGDIVAPWYGGTNEAPVIATNMYRYKNGRFEQLGTSWLKHSFCAISEPGCANCDPTGCNTLGVGCADTYWAGLNADADAPRSEINAATGEYAYPFSNAPSGPSSIRGKVQIFPDDIDPSLNSGALYFVEGQYVVTGESDFGTHLNNASSTPIRFTSTSNCQRIGETGHQLSAIMRWPALDSNATVVEVITEETGPNGNGVIDGLLHVGHSATENADGTWHYEFVVHNQNSHRSVGTFSIPVPDCVNISNVEYRGPRYHSGETISNDDWSWSRSGGMLTFSTDSHNDSNDMTGPAIRWASMANFRFDADQAPVQDDAMVGLWRSGPGASSLDISVKVPDCDDTDCPEDLNGDGVIGVDDILICVGAWGSSDGDVNGDGTTDVNDILALIGAFGSDC